MRHMLSQRADLGKQDICENSPWTSQKITSSTFRFTNKQVLLSASIVGLLKSLETCA